MRIKSGFFVKTSFFYCLLYSLTRAALGQIFGRIPYLLMLAAMGFLIALYFINYKFQPQKITKTCFYGGYFIYIIYLAFNLLLVKNAYTYAIYEYFFYILMFFGICCVLKYIDFEDILFIYEGLGVVLSIEAIWEFTTGNLPFRASTTIQGIRRACGLLGTPLTLGAIMSCIALIAFFMAQRSKKLFHYIAFVLCIVGLLVTQSRGPMVAFTVGMVVIMVLIERQKNGKIFDKLLKTLFKIIGLIILLYLIVVYFNGKVSFITTIYSRIQTIFIWSEEDHSNELRMTRWLYGLSIFSDHPWFGYGVSSTGNHSITGINVESGVIKKLAETGIIGFLLYYLTFGVTSFKSLKICSSEKAEYYPVAFSVIITIFVENIALQNIESLAVFLMFILCFTYLFTKSNMIKEEIKHAVKNDDR